MKTSSPFPGKFPHGGDGTNDLAPHRWARARALTFALLDNGTRLRAGIALQRAIMALIIVSILSSTLESVPEFAVRWRLVFAAIEFVSVVCFTLEYLLRLWNSVDDLPYAHLPRWRARLRWMISPAAIIDLAAVAPFYLNFLGLMDVRSLLALRILRFFKLTRYSPGARSLIDAIHSERAALLTCLMLLVSVALVSAALMNWAERDMQPDRFGTMPDALYWAMITLTTVGYGDAVPVTPFGKVIATISALLGIVMLALPIGILATSFAQVIQRREFVVTWAMIARVPLFDRLNAAEILEIMQCLSSVSAEPGEVIVSKGDAAASMFFISAGLVAVELPGRKVHLAEGQFFGESAMLRDGSRTATVRALQHTKLLVLDSSDLRNLMERRPDIAAAIEEVAKARRDPPG
ncbi:MAG: cyclic nucleotide-gated ion channel [Mesorhizobium sp.]